MAAVFAGKYRVTKTTLFDDISGACKENGHTSSVRLHASSRISHGHLVELLELVNKADSEFRSLRPVLLLKRASSMQW